MSELKQQEILYMNEPNVKRTANEGEVLRIMRKAGGLNRNMIVNLIGARGSSTIARLSKSKAITATKINGVGRRQFKAFSAGKVALDKLLHFEELSKAVYYLRERGWLLDEVTPSRQETLNVRVLTKGTLKNGNEVDALARLMVTDDPAVEVPTGVTPVYVLASIEDVSYFKTSASRYVLVYASEDESGATVLGGLLISGNETYPITDNTVVRHLQLTQVHDSRTPGKIKRPYQLAVQNSKRFSSMGVAGTKAKKAKKEAEEEAEQKATKEASEPESEVTTEPNENNDQEPAPDSATAKTAETPDMTGLLAGLPDED